MVQFLKYVLLALYQMILFFIKPISFINNLFASSVQVLKRQRRLKINVPSFITISPSLSPFSTSSSSSSFFSWSSSSSEDLQQLINRGSFLTPKSSDKSSMRRKLKQGGERRHVNEFPPPLPRRHPWVIEREYVEGRLILKQTRVEETRVESQEYIEVDRQQHGRLRLNLVQKPVPNKDENGTNMEQDQEEKAN